MIQDFEDLRTLCKSYNVKSMNLKKINIYAESHETIEGVLSSEVQNIIEKNQDYIESIEITDCQGSELNKGNNLKMILNLGKGKIKDKMAIHELIEGLFLLVDNLNDFTPS